MNRRWPFLFSLVLVVMFSDTSAAEVAIQPSPVVRPAPVRRPAPIQRPAAVRRPAPINQDKIRATLPPLKEKPGALAIAPIKSDKAINRIEIEPVVTDEAASNSSTCFRPRIEQDPDGVLGLYKRTGQVKDSRREVSEYANDSTCAKDLTQIACTIVPRAAMKFDSAKGQYSLTSRVPTMSEKVGLCPDERFAWQAAPGNCSCFLTGDNEVMTAGHCFGTGNSEADKRKGCDNSYIVFGLDMDSIRKGGKYKSDQVFSCNDIDARGGKNDPYKGLDITRIRLNESAANKNRKPLNLAKLKKNARPEVGKEQPLCLIGAHSGGPLKMALGYVRGSRRQTLTDGNSIDLIRSDLDGMGGTSGSMVVDCESGALVGMHVSGASDFEDSTAKAGNGETIQCKRPKFHNAEDVGLGGPGESIIWVGDIPESIWGGSSGSSQAHGVK